MSSLLSYSLVFFLREEERFFWPDILACLVGDGEGLLAKLPWFFESS